MSCKKRDCSSTEYYISSDSSDSSDEKKNTKRINLSKNTKRKT